MQAADPDAMEVDEGDGLDEAAPVHDYGIEVDFDSLGETLKEVCVCSHRFYLSHTNSFTGGR